MTTSVKLGEDLESRLNELVKVTGRSKSYYIREALIQKLEDLEDIYIAESRMENLGETYAIEDVEAMIDLEH